MEVQKRKTACPNRQLRFAREQRGWSQKSLADLLGTTELTVGRWERGERSPQPFYRARLCEVFGMTADALGFGEAEATGEASSDVISPPPNTQAIESSVVPDSPSETATILSTEGKRQKSWLGRMVLLAVAVLSVFGGIDGLYLAHPFPTSSHAGPGSARVSTRGTQPSNQSWVPPATTPVINDSLTQPDPQHQWGAVSICSFAGGGYHERSRGTNFCLESDTQFSDFMYELRVTIQQGRQAGMALRAGWSNHMYYFYVDITGHVGFQVLNQDAPVPHPTLLHQFSPAVRQGLNQPNVLGVEARGNTLRLFVNHTLVGSVQDATYIQGYIGVCVGNYDDPAESELTLASFRDAKVWDLGGN